MALYVSLLQNKPNLARTFRSGGETVREVREQLDLIPLKERVLGIFMVGMARKRRSQQSETAFLQGSQIILSL